MRVARPFPTGLGALIDRPDEAPVSDAWITAVACDVPLGTLAGWPTVAVKVALPWALPAGIVKVWLAGLYVTDTPDAGFVLYVPTLTVTVWLPAAELMGW